MTEIVPGVAPATILAFVVVFGLCIGSFLNVVIHRLPRMMQRQYEADARDILELDAVANSEPYDLSRPRSRCPDCGHAISAWENIPVLSWIALRGRCSGCNRRISARYPAVELIAALLGVIVFVTFGPTWTAVAALGLTWTLLALAFIDYDTFLLPDQLTLPLLWAGLIVNIAGTFVPLVDAVIGAALGYLFLWSVFHGFRLLTGKEGLGYGDFKLLGAFGAWLGWQQLPLIVIASSAIGAIAGIAMITLRRHDAGKPIQFGPFIAGAGFVSLVAGDVLVNAYLQAMR